MGPLLNGFADELCKLGQRTRVQVTPKERPKLGPEFARLSPQEQRAELAVPGAYTHRAKPASPAMPKFLTPGAWTAKELAEIRTGTSPIAKVQAKPRPTVAKR